ncbi:MAG: BamA/TamA family outer membrane protein, partial [Thermoanaerobaculia bacterium]
PEIKFNFKKSILNVDVETGKRAYVGVVISDKEIRAKELEGLIGEYFVEEKILKRIKGIEKKYRKDYPLIKINIKEKKFEGERVILNVEIKDMERIEFVFDKNMDKKDKKRILKKIENENTGIESIPFILEDFKGGLIRNGYRDAEISLEKKNDGKIEYLHINLKKGKKYKLYKISFEGLNNLKEEEIFKNSNIKEGDFYSFSQINNFIDYIKYLYWEKGFWDVSVKTKEEVEGEGVVSLKVIIDEGKPYFCEKVILQGVPEGLNLPALNLKENSPVARSNVEKDLQNIQRVLNDSGYYYARVSFEIENSTFYYKIDSGESYKINKIIYRGLNNIIYDNIKNEIKIKEGSFFSFKNLIDFQANLFSTSLFSSININPVHNFDKENTVNLYTELKEAPPMTYSYGIGYDSDNRFRLQFSFSHINFLKKRYILGFEGRLFSNQQMWRVSLRDPTFLNSNFPLFLGTYRSIEKRPSFSLKRWGSVVELTRNLGKKTQATLRYDYQIQIPFDVKENFPIPKEEEEKKVSAISLIYLNDTRDDIFFPREGSFFSSEFKYSFPFLFADTNFLKILMQYSQNITPSKNTTFALSTRVGYIKNYKMEAVPVGERLFLGGRNTVRAYSYDSLGLENDTVIDGLVLGGNMSFLLNLETRQLLSKSFGLNFFIDYGQVFSSYKKFKLDDLAGGYGMGSFFLTPIGPLRIEISKKFKSVYWDDDIQWYFSFGFPF